MQIPPAAPMNNQNNSSPASGITKLMKAHEALLNTLGASKHYWIIHVHRNAAAYYETWKKEYESQLNEKDR